jgi:hypothetical protein
MRNARGCWRRTFLHSPRFCCSYRRDGSPTETRSLLLVVTPQISADGYVHLSIVPAVAGRSEIVSESDSIVRVRLEQTVMISAAQRIPTP